MDEMKLAEQQHRGASPQPFPDEGVPHGAPMQTGSNSILALIEPFFANKNLIIYSLLASMLLGWLTLLLWPRRYESEARLLIKVGRESVSLDPTATTSETMMLQKTQEEEVNSALEVMSSRFVTEQTVKKLGADPVLNGYLPGDDGDPTAFQRLKDGIKNTISDGLFYALLAAGVKDDLSDHELAVMKLYKSVDIYSPKKSTVIIVNSKSRSPEMAQAISQEFVDTYLKHHLKTGRTEGSQRFFETQATVAENQLNELLDRHTAMLQERDIESIGSKREALLTTLTSLETTVRGRLNDLELQEVELGSLVTEDHPRFQRLRREVEEARSAVDAMQADLNQGDDATYRPVAFHESDSSEGAADSAVFRLLKKKNRVQKELGQLMNFQLELDDVERSINVARGRLETLRTKQEEARLIDELQSKQISNISVVQPATFIERPCSPKKKILAAGFVALGLLTGLGLVITKGINAQEIRSIHQLGDLRRNLLVVDIPSRPGLFRRFNSERRGRWKTPVMKSRFEPVLQEIVSIRQGSREGLVVGVTGLGKGVGTTTVAAALAVYADSEGIDSMLVTANPSTSDSTRQERSQQLIADHHAISERINYLNDGLLKQLNPDDYVSYNLHEYREELSRWMRSENELSIVDLRHRAKRNSAVDIQMVDCVVVVAEAEKSTYSDLTRCLRRLGSLGVPVATVVLNKSSRSIPGLIERLVS